MAEAVLMPKVGISVESCIITEWLKQPGDEVAVGDILFSYETDKSSMECESTAAGTLLEQFYANGDEVPVLVPVCAVGNAGEDVSALRGENAGQPAPMPQEAEAPATAESAPKQAAAPAALPAVAAGELKISPRARKLAQKQNVDPASATPTGPYGRVIERDIREAAAHAPAVQAPAASAQASGAPTQAEYEDKRFSGIRKVISKSMTASLATIPQLTHNFSFDASAILAYRASIKKNAEALGLPNITLNDMVLYAVCRILPKYPELNAHMLDGENIRLFKGVNLGIAVDTPRGLMVPVVHGADKMSLTELAAAAKALAKQAVEGSISPDDTSGGTFTVSNLGALGVESFTPVINPPQTGILGVDNITKRVRENGDGGIELYPAMGISLTYDHRAIDGAPASRFAMELCRALENFTLLLAE